MTNETTSEVFETAAAWAEGTGWSVAPHHDAGTVCLIPPGAELPIYSIVIDPSDGSAATYEYDDEDDLRVIREAYHGSLLEALAALWPGNGAKPVG